MTAANNIKGKFSGTVNQADTSIVLTDASSFPSTYPYILNFQNTELVKVTNKTSNTLIVVRSWEGTSAPVSYTPYTDPAKFDIYLVMSAAYIQELQNYVSSNQVVSSTITGDTTVSGTDSGSIFANTTSQSFTITLPSAVTYPGKIINAKKTDSTAHTATLVGVSGQTIDNGISYILELVNEFVQIQSDGSNWQVISE